MFAVQPDTLCSTARALQLCTPFLQSPYTRHILSSLSCSARGGYLPEGNQDALQANSQILVDSKQVSKVNNVSGRVLHSNYNSLTFESLT